ncbi:hypothetical protein NBRC10512_001624 [Rhodotorula toruloides]|uniref:RHTO0S12e05006g1_1 n=2 Tax=Rhodotorula toruloides TaxID=5286 RepID=A0A061BAT3_RHOTO|nr:cellobiohydrolase II [Rhodotorula toruloides NP11]EMS23119.1 cellobiohydrolase II [Rhodotorula toruloides NP11]CDR46484.1 RHTO0S12e05006g1_1 [Rhodotorula toruloides]
MTARLLLVLSIAAQALASALEADLPPSQSIANASRPTPITKSASLPRVHLNRRRHHQLSHDSHAISKRQVRNPQEAAKRWENRDEVAIARRAAPSATPVVCQNSVPAWGQCGGMSWTTDTCCVAGYICVYSNPYYSQCQPGTASSSSSSTASTSSSSVFVPPSTSSILAASPTPSSTACVGMSVAYGQCGGINYVGATCCPGGWTCQYSNDYYSQCLPGPSTSSSSNPISAPSSTPSSTKVSSPSALSSSSTSSIAPIPTAGPYGQCGGTGSSVSLCPSGFTCAFVNSYYYQCLPMASTATYTTVTTASFTTITRSASSSSAPSSTSATSTSSSATPSSSSCTGNAGAYGQCSGFLWLNYSCCPSGYECVYSSIFYSQCLPSSSTTSASTSSSPSSTSKASSTSSSSAALPSASPSACNNLCNAASTGSDGCTPYTVSYSGVTLPAGSTFQDNGHVNYQAIPKSQYLPGQTYKNRPASWTPQSFGVHFESLNNQPSGVYIGRNFMDFGAAAAAFPSGYCVVWVQLDNYNQHFGEGGQCPICTP